MNEIILPSLYFTDTFTRMWVVGCLQDMLVTAFIKKYSCISVNIKITGTRSVKCNECFLTNQI